MIPAQFTSIWKGVLCHANGINFLWGIVGSKGRDLPATSPFSSEHYVQSIG
jgi:hypothetical protein